MLRQNGEIVSFTFSCYVKMGRLFRLRFRVTLKWGDCFVYVFVLRQNEEIVSFTFSSYVKMGRSFRLRFRLTFFQKNVSYSPGQKHRG